MLSIEDKPPKQAVYVTNETLELWEGTVRWSLETLSGEVLTSGQEAVHAAPQAAAKICELDFSDRISDENTRASVFIAELWQGDKFVSRQTANFAPIKHVFLTDPSVTANLRDENNQLIIELTSRSLALLVEVSLTDADVVFSDNYFNLPANRTTRISCPMPAGWNLDKARKAFHLRSVYDSFSHGAVG
jgi:beta-mannosidase